VVFHQRSKKEIKNPLCVISRYRGEFLGLIKSFLVENGDGNVWKHEVVVWFPVFIAKVNIPNIIFWFMTYQLTFENFRNIFRLSDSYYGSKMMWTRQFCDPRLIHFFILLCLLLDLSKERGISSQGKPAIEGSLNWEFFFCKI